MDDRRLGLVVLGLAFLGALYGLLRAYSACLAHRIRAESRELRRWQAELEMCAHDVRTRGGRKFRD